MMRSGVPDCSVPADTIYRGADRHYHQVLVERHRIALDIVGCVPGIASMCGFGTL